MQILLISLCDILNPIEVVNDGLTREMKIRLERS